MCPFRPDAFLYIILRMFGKSLFSTSMEYERQINTALHRQEQNGPRKRDMEKRAEGNG